MRFVTTFLVVVFLASAIQGQTKPQAAAPSQDDQSEEEAQKVTVKYDKFKDMTTVSAGWQVVVGTELDGLALNTFFYFEGERLVTRPKSVSLLLAATAREWQFLRYTPSMLVIADGVRNDFGTPTSSRRDVGRGYVTEFFTLSVPVPLLERLANAKKAEIQFGSYEFELPDDAKKRLREFIKHTRP